MPAYPSPGKSVQERGEIYHRRRRRHSSVRLRGTLHQFMTFSRMMRIQTLQFLLVGWSWSLQWLWEDLVSYGQSFLQMGLVGSLQHLQKLLIVVGIRFTEASFWSSKYPAIFSDPSNPSRDIFNQMREKRNPPHPRMGEPQARSTPPNPGRVQEREWKTRVGISEINWTTKHPF